MYRIIADTVVVIHFLWILFMIFGFLFTVYAAVFRRAYLNFLVFRMVHLFGIFYVGLLVVLNRYCPLTLFEYKLRQSSCDAGNYSGSFIVDWIEKLVFPDVNPLLLRILTILIAAFTLILFILFPPRLKKST